MNRVSSYIPSPTMRSGRRSRGDMDAIRGAIYGVLVAENPMTVRQVFYQLVGRGAIEKTEAEYKQTVGRLLTDMRRAGEIPFEWIADNTRWMRKPRTYDSLRQMLELTKDTYRRALWNDQPAYVEIWLEKDALAGVVYRETHQWDVPLMVTRGYPSISYLHTAAETIEASGKPTHLYYFGDHDPSGRDITRATEEGLREFAPDTEIHFNRVAVTEEQITSLQLPTRPTKATDSRSKSFSGMSVEVDAIPPEHLRMLVRSSIQCHIDVAPAHRVGRGGGARDVDKDRGEPVWTTPRMAGDGAQVMATVIPSNPDSRVPDDLTEWDQWVLWRYEKRGRQTTKVPYSVRGYRASSTNVRDWGPFDIALRVLTQDPSKYAGLGFVFSADDPFVGIDLDDSLDQSLVVKPWARGIVERFADTYMEISPSGRGIKIWARGSLPANLPGVQVGDGSIELYDRARYFTVTGRAFRGAPLQVEDHGNDLLALYHRLTRGHKGWSMQPMPGGRIPYGQQHNTLVSICGTLRARGVCEEAIEVCLQTMNEKQCERPGPPANITRLIRSTRRWGRDERKTR